MDFDALYPTVEQIIGSNAVSLYDRKRKFLAHLRQLTAALGFVVIGIAYLRDLLLICFLLRAGVQLWLRQPNVARGDEARKKMSLLLLVLVVWYNFIIFIYHLVAGPYKESPHLDGLLHGGLTVQYIGEPLPTRTGLLALDVLVLCIQLLLHALVCETNDYDVSSTRSTLNLEETSDRLEIEGDGYNGNVQLVTLDVVEIASRVFAYDNTRLNVRDLFPETSYEAMMAD